MIRIGIFLAAAGLWVAGCQLNQPRVQLSELTADHFKNTVSIKNDSLDTTVTFTTFAGYQEKIGLLGIVRDDVLIRAWIDKKSKSRAYQVYQTIYYKGLDWRNYLRANYQTTNGPQPTALTRISHDVDCPKENARRDGCTFMEIIGFPVDEDTLRSVAAAYEANPAANNIWAFKFYAKSGHEYYSTITAAEIKGLLDRMDEFERLSM